MFKGPATSCDELGMIGYTLNGYYLVKAKAQSIDSSHKIEVVYCQFYQPLGLNHRGTKDIYFRTFNLFSRINTINQRSEVT